MASPLYLAILSPGFALSIKNSPSPAPFISEARICTSLGHLLGFGFFQLFLGFGLMRDLVIGFALVDRSFAVILRVILDW